jgi:hypothetical protein
LPGIRGARAGNRHALKHGRFTTEAKAERAHLTAVLRRARAVIANAKVLMSEVQIIARNGEK